MLFHNDRVKPVGVIDGLVLIQIEQKIWQREGDFRCELKSVPWLADRLEAAADADDPMMKATLDESPDHLTISVEVGDIGRCFGFLYVDVVNKREPSAPWGLRNLCCT